MRPSSRAWIVSLSLVLVFSFSARAQTLPAPLSPEKVEELWVSLGGHSVQANQAIWTLAAAPEQTVELARRKLLPVKVVDKEQIERWVADLDNPRFCVRQQAMARLEAEGNLALAALRRVRIEESPLEQRRRVEQLMQQCEQRKELPGHWQSLGLILALQHAATPEARLLLQALADGPEGTDLTEAAQRALKRMKER